MAFNYQKGVINNKYKYLFNNTIIFAIGSFGSRIITFLLVPLYTNVLTTEQYGSADLVMTCANIIVPIISVVIHDSVLRFGLDARNDKSEIIKNSFLVMTFGTIFGLIGLPVIGLYKPIAEWNAYLVIISITTMFSNTMLSYTKALERNKLYSFVSILNALVLALGSILFLVVLKLNVRGYLMANIVAQVVTVAILFLFTGTLKSLVRARINIDLLKQMLDYSCPLVVNNLSWWVLNSSDRVMIDYFCSTSELGLYTAASKIPSFLSVLTTIFSQAWTVSAIKEYDNDNEKRFYSKIFNIFSFAMFLGGSIVILITKPFMRIYVGAEFFESWRFVPFLVVGAVFFSFSSFFGAIYSAIKKNISVAITTVIAALLNIFINYTLLPQIGVIAAALSTACGYFTIAIIRMLHSQKYYKFEIGYKRYAVNTLVILLQATLVSISFYIYLVSAVTIIVLLIVNRSTFCELILYVKSLVTRRSK